MIREVLDIGGSAYIQTSADGFLEQANQYLAFNVKPAIIEEVKQAGRRSKKATQQPPLLFKPSLIGQLSNEEIRYVRSMFPLGGRLTSHHITDHWSALNAYPRIVTLILDSVVNGRLLATDDALHYLREIQDRQKTHSVVEPLLPPQEPPRE